ncbi:MAG: methionine--tRNA ligase [Candidatus Schekmanbacteria bacterium RIFCSPHIGHO2_02_FULL_38_11]|uniref:Methionine--tRNA ligase n=1 Tax=Candidatus Schekmanbacteria bacterium RIFCSPLOWO2_12_FULL_38_15 TaxID=1817883 RepID=A0A1F7SC76_9BACT|nr:MAG: methionine--tRNA ligase [Candidatus Schekmanbacteria bacterium RIFCSPHIGHO2_02_FULL_38_11]OGL49309.1 MAG: methionine--tRNA ligase [Candidatus Schekmanbacteria bacterium RIFCSPLOWO2_02_FULL_38_14]OGL51369.1 MAG: methionine--tRNA ligase [Candidatus Schekmanbacteria bacterium RIFCSPLOWO2_12_FULL_38_15]
MGKSFYITTPIYYVNDVPHIGHAYTSVACDVVARAKRLQGYNVVFATGTDEHGQKVEKAATASNETPISLANRVVERFKSLWIKLDISYDDFIRTTEPRHSKAVAEIFKTVYQKGDIYLGEYEDWYCTPCETFLTETQLNQGNCPDCGRKPDRLKEESYFFRMSKYQDSLLEYYRKNPDFIKPRSRMNEIVSFVQGGLKDLSISRTSFKWGIPVPLNEKHVIYVWFDALANYLTIAGYPDNNEKFQNTWPADVHVIGKDILRFHAVYWPAFLMSAGIDLPKKVFAHGWWTVEGTKMSKSLMNVVEPNRLIDEFGADPLRYFLLREVPFGLDGNFSMEAFVQRYNADLANDLGNLFSRALTILQKYHNGEVPEMPAAGRLVEEEKETENLKGKALQTLEDATKHISELAFNRALISIWDLINAANKYIDSSAPWALAKKGENEKLAFVSNTIARLLKAITILISPFMPSTAEKMWHQMGFDSSLQKISVIDEKFFWNIKHGLKTISPSPLFPRMEKKNKKEEAEKMIEQKGTTPESDLITIEDFQKVNLRVGKIISAERVPKAEKLLKIEIDLGAEKRTILAGIAKSYAPEKLIGKSAVIVANLKPAKLFGIESQGMLLAASKGDELRIVTFEDDADIGAKVK